MEGNGSVSGGGGGGGGGMDFQLAEEIMAVIPSDPYEQLDLARKITSMAIAARVSNLEAEVGRLRQKLSEKDRVIFELEEAASRLQRVNHDVDSRLRIALEDNVRLAKERDSVAMTAKKLSRDLAKMIRKTSTFREEYGDELLLETFKRQLMQSLNDDNSSPARTVDIGTCDQAVPRAYPDKDEETNGYSAQYSSTGSTDKGNTTDEALRNAGPKFSLTPYITPRLTPTATPKVFSTTGSPRAYSTIASPQQTSGPTSPTKSYDGRNSVSSWYPSSQQSSAANSPPRGRPLSGRTPRIDGKEFFRQARSRLSYEQFSAFLANIKELNAQKQTREETLRKAEEIFGTDNKDLYLSFQGLLSRNVH